MQNGLWETRRDVRVGKSGGSVSREERVGRSLKERSRCVIDVKTGAVSRVSSGERTVVMELWESISF